MSIEAQTDRAVEELPKIFIGFTVTATWAPDLSAYAKTEDGDFLSGHICSNESFVMSDMLSRHYQRDYAARFPGGYQVIWERTGEVLETVSADQARRLAQEAEASQ